MKPRSPAKRIVLYNHKGGVGKTTLTVNIAAALANAGKRILLVDADPQCNITSYLVNADVVNKWLDESDSEKGMTIWSAIKPFTEGTGEIRIVKPVERRSKIFLIPGDIKLSEFEQELHDIWADVIKRRVRGFKGSSVISDLVNEISIKSNIDYIFYDVGPNIGPLNRAVLLDCDYFIVPAACDLFSTRALSTLGHSLSAWIREWEIITQLAPDNTQLLPGRPKFLGYILQRFRVYGGAIAEGYSYYATQLEKAIQADIVSVLRRVDKTLAHASPSANKLGQVKDFGKLATVAQDKGIEFSAVTNPGMAAQRAEAKAEFDAIAKRIIERTLVEDDFL